MMLKHELVQQNISISYSPLTLLRMGFLV